MTDLALTVDPELKVQDLIDYVKNRSEIRKIIARDIGITENRAKDIFTSLGFGASVANNPFTSIRGKLSQDQYDLLMKHRQFKHIIDAVARVRDTILGHYGNSFVLEEKTYQNVDPNSDPLRPSKRTKNQKLAWIYQVLESTAIAKFSQSLVDAGYEPIMFAHDCVYYKTKVAPDAVNGALYLVNKQFPNLRIEHEEVIPIHKNLTKSDALVEYEDMVEAHKALVDAEEIALNGLPKPKHDLDPDTGYFAQELKALGQYKSNIGTTFKMPGMS